jgi:hypothetical protein
MVAGDNLASPATWMSVTNLGCRQKTLPPASRGG